MAEQPVPRDDISGGSSRPSRMPDTLIIVFVLAIITWLATFLVTPGRFSLADGTPPRLVPGSFELAAGPMPAPFFGAHSTVGFANLLFEGLVSGSRTGATIGLMGFLLVLGGVFGMLSATGAMDRSLQRLLDRRGASGGLIVGLFIAFSIAGAVFGMAEEAIAFTLILTPALVRAGYDSLTALITCYVATQIGFATSWMNPFSLVIAQSISGVPVLSGLEVRLAIFTVFTLLGAAAACRYAQRVQQNPALSLTRLADERLRAQQSSAQATSAKPRRGDGIILLILLAAIVWVAWGVIARGYFLPEIAAQFMAMGLAIGLVAWAFGLVEGPNALATAFRDGAAGLLPAVLVVGFAKGILAIAGGDQPDQFTLLNTLLNAAAGFTAALPDWLTAWGMLLVQTVINFFVSSGSGQAAITMPLMAPLADLSGVTRQTAVLAFQFGDGFSNLILPTSAATMGCLAAAKIDFALWVKFIWKPMLAIYALASAILIAAHAAGFS